MTGKTLATAETSAKAERSKARTRALRFFTIEEIAEALAIGKRTVDRHWQVAKAWLCFRLGSD